MVQIICGTNTFLINQEARAAKSRFIEQYGSLAVEVIDGEETDYSDILSAAESMPFLSSKKLVIAKNLSLNKTASEKIEELLAKIPSSTDFILIETKLDKRSAYYKFLKKQPGFKEFSETGEKELAAWVVSYARAHKAEISNQDANYLVERSGLSQQKLSNELAKLIVYNPKITKDTIDELVELTPSGSIFGLIDAVFYGDSQRTLKLYETQRAMGVEPQNILGMIVWQLHAISLMKQAAGKDINSISQASGLKPFTLQKSQAIADKMTKNQLQKILDELLDLDLKMKTTSIDPDNAIKNFLVTAI